MTSLRVCIKATLVKLYKVNRKGKERKDKNYKTSVTDWDLKAVSKGANTILSQRMQISPTLDNLGMLFVCIYKERRGSVITTQAESGTVLSLISQLVQDIF